MVLTATFAAVVAILILAFGRYFRYRHELVVVNDGPGGIILLDIPAADFRDNGKRPDVVRLRPAKPHQRIFGSSDVFSNDAHLFPDEATLIWQLADVSHCDEKPLYQGCVFTPIPGKVYRKRLNLKAMRASAAGQLAGRSAGFGNGRITLVTEIRIREDEIKVGVRNSRFGGISWN